MIFKKDGKEESNLVGKKASDFELAGHDGKIYKLKDLSGKNVVLVFYCMNNTPG